MKKELKFYKLLWIGLMILELALFVIVMKYRNNESPQNIFDDMYQNLQTSPNQGLADNLGGSVKYRNYKEPGFEKNLYVYSASNKDNSNDKLPISMSSIVLKVQKGSSSESLFVHYDYQLNETILLKVILAHCQVKCNTFIDRLVFQ